MSNFIVNETEDKKEFLSKKYNFKFDKKTGFFIRYGTTMDENPEFSEFGPEIADIEISTSCSGLTGTPCSFCYKTNTPKGTYMSYSTFKKVFHNLPRTLTQIAFGIGDIDANPDIWDIFDYCRNNEHNEVVPNVTINGARLTPETLDNLAKYCGAVAVSRYNPSDFCYDAVEKLSIRGMNQINIHMLLSRETYEDCFKVLDDAKEDPRLKDLNAIVFLSLKPKGRGKNYSCLKSKDDYKKLIDYAFDKGVNIGFDSCSAPLFLNAVNDRPDYQKLVDLAEPCESYLFSIYIDVNGKSVPCSFLSGMWPELDMTQENLELDQWWNFKSTTEWREKLLATANSNKSLIAGCRQCPMFEMY